MELAAKGAEAATHALSSGCAYSRVRMDGVGAADGDRLI